MNGIDFIVDTNFLIYTLQQKQIVDSFLDYNLGISFISEMGMLGVFSISKLQKENIKEVLEECYILDFNLEIKNKAIQLKQKYKIKIPDAIHCCHINIV